MMEMRPLITAMILCLVFVSGCGEDDTGAISGAIVTEDEELKETIQSGGMMVYIPGTSYVAMTDENGEYIITDLPPGIYTVKTSYPYPEGTELTDIEVKAGETITAPDLVPLSLTSSTYWSLSSVYFYEGTRRLGDEYLMTGESSENIGIAGYLYSYTDSEEQYLDQICTLTVSINDRDSVEVPIRKNQFSYDIEGHMLDTGENSIAVIATDSEGTTREAELTLYYYDAATGLVVTLEWDKVGDMDLHLIGPDGTDCCYSNKHPDWGVADDKEDDPLYVYDEQYGYNVQETIILPNPPDGTYLVKVHFFGYEYEPSRRESIRPSVEIILNGEDYRFNAKRSMQEGDEWQVTSFTLPGGVPMAPAKDIGYIQRIPPLPKKPE
jgi:hypothetical protein